jgi:hypothetical protein
MALSLNANLHTKVAQSPYDPWVRVWQGGGKGVKDPDVIVDDPDMLDIVMSLGPWSEADKLMARSLGAFRRELASGIITTAKRAQEASVGKGGARIVFGMLLHDDMLRFRALWRALFHEEHYFIIHVDRTPKDPSIRGEILRTIGATRCKTGSVWDRVFVIGEEESVDSLWGDITLVYSEYQVYIALMRQAAWDWDYFINVSGQSRQQS